VDGIWGLFSRTTFGILSTNPLHAVIHVALGIGGLWAVRSGFARSFLLLVGGLLAVVGALWFVPAATDFLVRALNLNRAVAFLNLGVAAISIVIARKPIARDTRNLDPARIG
jgi:Domain of unknown function (DUF4383)